LPCPQVLGKDGKPVSNIWCIGDANGELGLT